MNSTKRHVGRWVLQVALSFSAGFALSFTGLLVLPFDWPGLTPVTPPPALTSVDADGIGEEIVFIYIGSSTCSASRRSEVLKSVAELREKVNRQAVQRNVGFASVGIACQWSVRDGLEHLEQVGPFDEVIAGRNWLNTGALRWLWDETPGIAATPQIVVVQRALRLPSRGVSGTYSVGDERILIRKVGAVEIENWGKAGGLVPHR